MSWTNATDQHVCAIIGGVFQQLPLPFGLMNLDARTDFLFETNDDEHTCWQTQEHGNLHHRGKEGSAFPTSTGRGPRFLCGALLDRHLESWGQEPYLAEILPHPRVHLVIAPDQSRIFGVVIFGVVKGKFSYLHEQTGRVFGVRFKPGAFYPFVHVPVAQLTNASISLAQTFGVESTTLEEVLLEARDEATMIKCMEQFLRTSLPERDEQIVVIQRMFDHILTHREITRVDDVVCRFNLTKRTLQRLFQRYVGVSPKWVIKHSRLHEIADRLAKGVDVNWSKLALDLGYYDQALLPTRSSQRDIPIS